MLEATGVAVFALTGALVAARKGMDPFGFILLAAVTGVGGGGRRGHGAAIVLRTRRPGGNAHQPRRGLRPEGRLGWSFPSLPGPGAGKA